MDHGVRVPRGASGSRTVPADLVAVRVRDQPGELAGNMPGRVDLGAAAERDVADRAVDQESDIRRRHPAVLGRAHPARRPASRARHAPGDVQARHQELPAVPGLVLHTDRRVRAQLLHAVPGRRGRRQQVQPPELGHVQDDRHAHRGVRHVRLAAVQPASRRQPRAVPALHIPHRHRAGQPAQRSGRERYPGHQGRRGDRRPRVPRQARPLLRDHGHRRSVLLASQGPKSHQPFRVRRAGRVLQTVLPQHQAVPGRSAGLGNKDLAESKKLCGLRAVGQERPDHRLRRELSRLLPGEGNRERRQVDNQAELGGIGEELCGNDGRFCRKVQQRRESGGGNQKHFERDGREK